MWHDQIIANIDMDINNANDLQTHKVWIQDICKSHLFWQKVIGNTLLHMDIVIDERLTCNVNQVYMYMVLVVNIYVFQITMGLLN